MKFYVMTENFFHAVDDGDERHVRVWCLTNATEIAQNVEWCTQLTTRPGTQCVRHV